MRRFAVVAPRHLALLMVTLLSVGAIQPGEILAAGPAPSTEPVRDRAVEQLGPRVIERPVAELGSTSGGGSAGAGVGPTPGDVSIGVRPTTKQPPLDPREMWTEGSRTLVDANGRYTVEAVAGRMNYQDASGEWQPIDLTLVPDAAVAGYGLRTKANDRIVHFGQQDAGDALARLSTGKGTLAVRALDFQSSLVAGPGAPTPSPTPAPTVEPSASPSAPPPSASPTPGPSDPPTGSATPSPAAPAEVSPQPSAVPALSPDVSPAVDPAAASVSPQPSDIAPAASADPTSSTEPSALPSPSIAPSPSATAIASPSPTPAAPAADPNVLRFAKDAATGDVVVLATDYGFEFGAVVARPDQTNVYGFALDAGKLTPELGIDGKTIVLSQTSFSEGVTEREVVGGITAPVMLDANDVPAPLETVKVELIDPTRGLPVAPTVPAAIAGDLRPTEIGVVYTIDPTWLAAPERAFPVTLDPNACLGEGASGCDINGTGVNFDHFIASGLGTSYPIGWNVFRVGYDVRSDDGDVYNIMRGLLYFEDVALPEAAVVYNTSLNVHISSEYGGPNGETITAFRAKKAWGQTTSYSGWGTGGYDSSPSASVTVPASGTMSFDVDAIVQSWYTRRGKDWKPDIGFLLKMDSEGSTHGEVEFDRYNDTTATSRPKLTISYDVPRVGIDFDPSLGATYAPSTMVAGQATVLPIRVSNNASGFDFVPGTWVVGYRWFDAKGNIASSAQQALPQCVGTGSGCVTTTSTFGLNVTPPATPGQYTLRLDLIRNGTIDAYASDWARPSLFYSRNKKTLSGDDTRWVGTSKIERDEFGISVIAGGGGDGDSVDTGTGSLGIDLWSKNLSYAGSGGVGFDDVIPMQLDYGYDSRHAADCAGILDACGWSTTWDERLVSDPANGTFTYVDPDGTRHLVGSDGDGQLTSGADVLLQRQRATFADERVPSNTPTASLVVPPSPGAFSGQYAVKVAAGTSSVSLGTIDKTNLNAYRLARFAIKASSAASSGLGFRIHNATTGNDTWQIYTVGTSWTSPAEQIHLGGTINGATWAYYTRDLYNDVRGNSAFGGWTDDYEVTAVTVYNKAGSTGDIYVDGLRLEPAQAVIVEDNNPSWSSNPTLVSVETTDVVDGTSLRINPASISGSPDCNSSGGAPCWPTTAGGLWAYGFVHWQWKKVGGQTAAVVFHLRNERSNTTGDLTYYAGPTPPAGALNPIQVSDTVPTVWSLVRRNLLEDARQVLNFYNDNAAGSSPSAPPTQGPTPDDVRLIGYRLVAYDGSFLLIDDFDYSTASDVGEDQMSHPSSTGDSTFTYDFTATYPDGSVHVFDEVGLLERIVDRDGNKIDFDWSIPSLTVAGATGYQLDRVHSASDASTSGFGTYDRDLQLSYGGSAPRTVTVTERLGTTGTPITGRTTVFAVATGSGTGFTAGDLVSVKPARGVSCAAPGSASACDLFSYSASLPHMLAFVGDPRWDQTTTTAPSDYRFEVTWAGTSPNQYPTSIIDRSAGTAGGTGTPLLRVLDYAVSGGVLPASRRVAWQDAAAISKNFARYTDLTADGRTLAESIPLACGAAACATLPSTSNLVDKRASESQFDGLSRVSTSITYRCPGVSVSGCTGTSPQKIVSRQGSKAGAKVDNFNDPLTSGQLGWSQSPDQYVASLRDSAGSNPDLYRTTYTYDANGQRASVSRPARNGRPAYVDTIENSTQIDSLYGYWRLDESSGPARNEAGGRIDSTYQNFAAGYGSSTGALIGTPGAAPSFDGVNDYVSTPPPFSSITGSFTIEAWFRPADTVTSPMSIVGSRAFGESFDLKVDKGSGRAMLYADVGNGTSWLAAGIQGPIVDYTTNRWYHAALVVDDAIDRAFLYLDGQPIATGAFTGTPLFTDTGHRLVIGQNGSATPEYWKGGIDEVAAYTQALTPAQVASHFMAGRSIAVHTSRTLRDQRWRDIQVDDQFLAGAGFESGPRDWELAGAATVVTALSNPASDTTRFHQPTDPTLPPSWSSLEIGAGGSGQQIVALVPGQTSRVQVWDRRSGTSGSASISLDYWRALGTPGWVNLKNQAYADTSWAGHAWDVTIPFDGDGRLRISLSATGLSGSDKVYFDDAAVVTSYVRTTYTSKSAGDAFDGLVRETITFSPTQSGPIGEFVAHNAYAASAAAPAIYPTTVTANYVDGIFSPSAPDIDVSTTRTLDAWGHELTTTDQDGVGLTTVYYGSGTNGFATDVQSTTNSLGEPTSFEYDVAGNQTKVTAPGTPTRVTQTSYDQRNHPRTVTDPLGIVSRDVYDGYGFLTSSIANRLDDAPSGPGGLDDVTTTYDYDEYGVVTSTLGNTGVTGIARTRSEATHDLTGSIVETKPFAAFDGTTFSAPRTMTQLFEVVSGATRPKPSASRGPGSFVATSSSPECPDGSGLYCNSVGTLDQDGQVVATTDAYKKVTRVYRDLAGRPAVTVKNYDDGIYSAADPAKDVLSTTSYDLFGRPARTVDVLGRATETTFDSMGRAIQVRTIDDTATALSDQRTRYTGAGRTDRVSLPGQAGVADSALTWTKTVYDKAGRAIKTLEHYDIGLTAALAIDSFEAPITDITINNDDVAEAWSSGAGAFIASGATTTLQSPATTTRSGAGRLSVTTGSGANTGAEWALDGTFTSGDLYKARIWFTASPSVSVSARLGVAADAGTVVSVTGNNGWQAIDVTWTPTANRTAVKLAVYRQTAGVATFYVDDAVVWDSAAGRTDWNIPTETAYDLAGRIVASIVPPGTVGTAESTLVTRTVYDLLDRPTSVTVNEVAGVGGGGSSTTFTPTADAHVRSASVSSNYGTATTLQVRADAATPNDYKPYLKFNVTGLTGTVTNVKLRLNNTAAASNSSRIACVYAISDTSWTETGITWSNAPTMGASLACVNGAQAAGWIEYDLGTPFSGNGTYAFAVFENVSTSVIYHSKEGTSPPELVVTTSGAGSDNVSNLQTATAYDALGRTASTTDPSGTVTTFGYDRLGRLTSTVENYLDGSASGASGDDDVTSRFGYDAAGELTGYCSGKQVFVGGCDENSPSSTQAWRYAFDDAGHMARQTPPVNATATALVNRLWEYDTGGRLTKVCDGPSSITSCASAGVLRTFESTYDDVGRVTRTDTKSGPSTTLAGRIDTTFLGDGQPLQTKYSTGTTPTVVDTIDHAYDHAGRQTKLLRGATVLSERAFNPDGTIATRKDGDNAVLGQSAFGYDWAQRLTSVDLPDSQFSTAVPTFSWRLDGLIGGRTWSGSSATFGYDAAKRVTSLTKGSLSFSQAYDRDGNVTSEGRSLTGVTGDPGTGTQAFSYDALGRVTGSSGLASGSRSYTYDRDSNRLTKVQGGSTYTYTYDRTDQLINVTKTGGSAKSFGYDAYGNMTIDAQTGLTITNMSYDLDDHLTGIDAGGTANDATFSLDALGRFKTRTLATGTETYSYVDSSETVARVAGPGGTNTDSIVSPAGDRLGVRVGATVNWFLPDLHGNVAASLDAGETTVVNAIRYDPWGETIATGTAGGTRVGDKTWKYQGRLDVSPDGLSTPLYDMSARFYMPGAGTFTQLDTVMGSAQDPLSMNRFLYAQANPATLIDPTGHYSEEGDGGPTHGSSLVKSKSGHVYRRSLRALKYRFYRLHYRGGRYERVAGSAPARRSPAKRVPAQLIRTDPAARVGYGASIPRSSGMSSILAANGYSATDSRENDHDDESQFIQMTWMAMTPNGPLPVDGFGPCAERSDHTQCHTAADFYAGSEMSVAKEAGVIAREGAELTPQLLDEAAEVAERAWQVGDDIYRKIGGVKEPSWSTVRARYWKNAAAMDGAVKKYGQENVGRMRLGLAPTRPNPRAPSGIERLELSHEPTPRRDGGTELRERWPCEHALIDPLRRPGYC